MEFNNKNKNKNKNKKTKLCSLKRAALAVSICLIGISKFNAVNNNANFIVQNEVPLFCVVNEQDDLIKLGDVNLSNLFNNIKINIIKKICAVYNVEAYSLVS